jgi:hypothetical protein
MQLCYIIRGHSRHRLTQRASSRWDSQPAAVAFEFELEFEVQVQVQVQASRDLSFQHRIPLSYRYRRDS